MLNNLTIKLRLQILLAALLSLAIIMALLGLHAAHTEDNFLDEIYKGNVLPIIDLNNVEEALMHVRQSSTNAALYPERSEKYIKEIEDDQLKIKKTISESLVTVLVADNEVALFKKMKVVNDQFDKTINSVIAMAKAGDNSNLKTLLEDHLRPDYYAFKEVIDELTTMQEKEAHSDKIDSDIGIVRMTNIMIVTILIGSVLCIAMGLSVIWSVTRSIDDMSNVMSTMSNSGDLTLRAKVLGKNEIGRASLAFNSLIESLAGIIRQVSESTRTVSSTAETLATSSLRVTQGSEVQSEAAASTAAAVEQITVSINSVAANTEDVRKLAELSLQQTQKGNQNVDEMIGEIRQVQEAVNQIASSVKEFVDRTRAIAGMTQQVKDIADQTNLLALNAAIEAARAGEQGRGFAVVADEVRKLAEKSAQSASEIDKVTSSLDQKSSDVETAVNNGLRSLQTTQEHIELVSKVLAEASAAVTGSNKGIGDITTSIRQQSEASSDIARNVEKISQMSEENHAAIESISKQIRSLNELSSELQTSVSRFRV
jgi:methyl-accepting chemotaxis protein